MEFTLSIANTSITVVLEESLEQTGADLKKLYAGFLSNHQKADASLTVSRNDTTYWNPGENQVMLPEEENPETVKIVNKIGNIYRLLDDSMVAGYKNGCLAYNHFSNKGHLILFQAKDTGIFIVCLYNLLFLFISLILAEQKKLVIHGAGIKKKDAGYLFLGESGAGKTTVSSFTEGGDVLSDDSPVIARENGTFYIYTFPYSQINMFEHKRDYHHLKKTELKKLLFLKKGGRLFVEPRDKKSALAEIVKKHIHSFEFMGSKSRTAAFDLCYDLCSSIPVCDLHFQKNDRFWDII